MGARHLAATATLAALSLACAPRTAPLPSSVALEVSTGESEPRVLWVAPGPEAWEGPVIGQAVDGFQEAFRSRLGRVVGAARLVRWVQGGALEASLVEGLTLSDEAPWVLRLEVQGWGLRTAEEQVETFLELGVSLLDESGTKVWTEALSCSEPLLQATVPGAAVVARAVVGIENEDLRERYAQLAKACGEQAWALASDGQGRRAPRRARSEER